MSFPFQDPLQGFLVEYEKAAKANIPDPHAMSLATVSAQGFPSVRIVYYKGMVRDALGFYTNYQSQKSRELEQSGRACVNFFWSTLQQQIRIEGPVSRMTRDESVAYFQTRPRLSQLGAWASAQSQEIPSYEWLQARVDQFDQQFSGQDVPCPDHWGGFRLQPLKMEFWYGHQGRLHERYCFERPSVSDILWKRYLKSP